jgi:hypothetical protein
MTRLTFLSKISFASVLLASAVGCNDGTRAGGDTGAASPEIVQKGAEPSGDFRIDCRVEETLLLESEDGAISDVVNRQEFGLDLDSDASDFRSLGAVEGREFALSFLSTADTGDGVFVNLKEASSAGGLRSRTRGKFHGTGVPGSYEVELVYGFDSATDEESTRVISATCTLTEN